MHEKQHSHRNPKHTYTHTHNTGAYLSPGYSNISTSRTLMWTPERGTEGRQYRICFSADDVFGMRSAGKRCVGATQVSSTWQDDGCRIDSDCGVCYVCLCVCLFLSLHAPVSVCLSPRVHAWKARSEPTGENRLRSHLTMLMSLLQEPLCLALFFLE